MSHNAGMHHRRLALLLVLAPLVLAACGGSKTAATTAVSTAAPAVQAPVTIVVKSISVTSVSHDQPPKGASKGDRITFTDTLLNTSAQFGLADAAEVGNDHGTMSFSSDRTARLMGTATLPNGTINFNGIVVVNADGTLSVAVVGGTGKYAHAKGSLKVGKGTKKALNTYVLNFAGAADTGPVA